MTALYDIAHARSGDKGTLNTVSLIPYDERWYPVLREVVTAEVVAEHLRERYPGGVVRYELANLSTLIFVCRRLPGDTVTTSLYLDAHAKSLSSALLELEIAATAGADRGTPGSAPRTPPAPTA